MGAAWADGNDVAWDHPVAFLGTCCPGPDQLTTPSTLRPPNGERRQPGARDDLRHLARDRSDLLLGLLVAWPRTKPGPRSNDCRARWGPPWQARSDVPCGQPDAFSG
jgi:hypothetical protein